MYNRRKINQPRIIIPMVAAGCALMCISVGFASWVTTSGGGVFANGNIEADSITEAVSGPVDAFGTPTLNVFSMNEYGLDVDGAYKNSGAVISGDVSFNKADASTVIASLRQTPAIANFQITLTGTSSFETNGVTITSAVFNGVDATIGSLSDDKLSYSANANLEVGDDLFVLNFAFYLSTSNLSTFITNYSVSGSGFKVTIGAYNAL